MLAPVTARTRTTPAAVLQRVAKRHPDGTVALVDVDLVLGAGERMLVTGPPGSGTTSLLRILAGRSVPTGGSALVLGVPVHLADQAGLRALRRRVALLDGGLHVPSAASVLEAVEVAAAGAVRAATRPLDALDRVGGLDPARRVGDLDPGERARVALAMVAVRGPWLVVADDPWRALDPGLGSALGGLACRMAAEAGSAVALAGRDTGAFAGIDRVVRLRHGRVVA